MLVFLVFDISIYLLYVLANDFYHAHNPCLHIFNYDVMKCVIL